MSTQRNLDVHCRTKASSAVPLEVIAELIESEVGPIQREPGGIFFDGTVGTTHIRVTPVDGPIAGYVQITGDGKFEKIKLTLPGSLG